MTLPVPGCQCAARGPPVPLPRARRAWHGGRPRSRERPQAAAAPRLGGSSPLRGAWGARGAGHAAGLAAPTPAVSPPGSGQAPSQSRVLHRGHARLRKKAGSSAKLPAIQCAGMGPAPKLNLGLGSQPKSAGLLLMHDRQANFSRLRGDPEPHHLVLFESPSSSASNGNACCADVQQLEIDARRYQLGHRSCPAHSG